MVDIAEAMTMAEDNKPSTDGEFLFHGRLVPMGRQGNIVYARTLRRDEEDTGEAVHLNAGDRLVIPTGEFVFDTDQIDALSPKRMGGYAPLANTVWTWHQIVGEEPEYAFFLFALAQRLDAAHDLWSQAIRDREDAINSDGIVRRAGLFEALATAQMAIIAFGRAIIMVETLVAQYCPDLKTPEETDKVQRAVRQLRRSFEHIDERAQGKAAPNNGVDLRAWSIFDQSEFVERAILRYQGDELNFQKDVLAALLACREVIKQSFDSRIKSRGHDNQSI